LKGGDIMEVFLIRHTETTLGKEDCYGQSNIPLQRPFLSSFDKIVNEVEVKNAVIYSSPLEMCKQLASHFRMYNESIDKMILDDRLKERNFGDWELKKWDKINQQELNMFMADFVEYKVPNGESFIQFYNRVDDFINEELIKKKHQAPVIIITHAGVIRSFLCKILEHPLKNAFKISVDHGSITKIILSENNCSNNIEFANKNAV